MVRCILKSEKSKELKRKGNIKLSHAGTLTRLFFLFINTELKLSLFMEQSINNDCIVGNFKVKCNKATQGLTCFLCKQSLSVFLPTASILNVDFSWYLIYVEQGDLKNKPFYSCGWKRG